MAPEDSGRRRSVIGTVAYLLVPGERRRRAAGHFGRAAIEAAKGVRALSVPTRPEGERSSKSSEEETQNERDGSGRQRIEID